MSDQTKSIVSWVIIGAIAGALASLIVGGSGNLIGWLIAGLIGSVVGGFLAQQLKIKLNFGNAFLLRSHRANHGKARLNHDIDKKKAMLGVPDSPENPQML